MGLGELLEFVTFATLTQTMIEDDVASAGEKLRDAIVSSSDDPGFLITIGRPITLALPPRNAAPESADQGHPERCLTRHYFGRSKNCTANTASSVGSM
jgi:hypothetical protein